MKEQQRGRERWKKEREKERERLKREREKEREEIKMLRQFANRRPAKDTWSLHFQRVKTLVNAMCL